MAGFELTLYGRIWVTPKDQTKAMDKMEQYVSAQKIAHAERTVSQASAAIQHRMQNYSLTRVLFG
jgi:hypothetical protein